MEEEKLSFGLQDVKIIPEEIEAGIIGMRLETAKEIYGELAKRPDQLKLVLELENNQFNVKTSIPITYYKKGEITNRTHIGRIIKRYCEKYGYEWQLTVGSKIELISNSKGFWDIKL